MRTLEAIEAKEQLIRTLKTACELAWYICTIAERHTKDHEIACQIKYCIELALKLLGQKRYVERQALKHLAKETNARKPTYSSDELSQVTFNTMEEAREYVTGSLGEHANEYDIDAILNHCVGLSYGYGALKIKGHGYDYWDMIEEYKI